MELKLKRKKLKRVFGTPTQKKLVRPGWPKRLGLVQATEFAVVGVQLCSNTTAIFQCVALP